MSKYIHARVYRGKDDDLINWLEELPPGRRSEMIRQVLRVGIGLIPPSSSEHAELAAIVRKAVNEALAGLQIVAAQQGMLLDTNEVEEAFGEQLDKLLSSLSKNAIEYALTMSNIRWLSMVPVKPRWVLLWEVADNSIGLG